MFVLGDCSPSHFQVAFFKPEPVIHFVAHVSAWLLPLSVLPLEQSKAQLVGENLLREGNSFTYERKRREEQTTVFVLSPRVQVRTPFHCAMDTTSSSCAACFFSEQEIAIGRIGV